MNFPKQTHKQSLSKLAKKYSKSIRTMENWARETGLSKTRDQYERDAKIRREAAYNLRLQGLKYKEIGEKLGISEANAKMLVRRHVLD